MQATFKVDGMSIRGGILWMGWPTDIGKALDGLNGVNTHIFNMENRKFYIKYNANVVDKIFIINTIESSGNFNVKDWEFEK